MVEILSVRAIFIFFFLSLMIRYRVDLCSYIFYDISIGYYSMNNIIQ